MEKYCRAGQATDYNMAHAHCLLDSKVFKYALRICNTYCFSTATVLAQTRLDVTLFVCTLPVLLRWRQFVYWAVRTDSLNVIQVDLSSLERLYHGSCS